MRIDFSYPPCRFHGLKGHSSSEVGRDSPTELRLRKHLECFWFASAGFWFALELIWRQGLI